MLRLRTHAQVYALLLFRLGIAMDKVHDAKEEFGKDSLVWRWRYRLVANAGKRVTDYEKAHPELLAEYDGHVIY